MVFSLPTWLIVAIILVIVLILLFRVLNQVYVLSLFKDNFFYFVLFGIFVFVGISLTYIHTHYEIEYTTLDGIKELLKIYYYWAANVFSNIGRVTSYVIQQDWVNASVKGKP